MYQRILKVIVIIMLMVVIVSAQDSVDVTFYYKSSSGPSIVYLPGEFNGWLINSSKSAMTFNPVIGKWYKTVRLRVGGPNPLPVPGKSIPGAYQYKFNEDGSNWLQDPLNPRQNPLDNNNSYVFINNPTIHYLLPNSLVGFVEENQPEITAYISPSTSTTVDTASIKVILDSITYEHVGAGYDQDNHFFSFKIPDPLTDGQHVVKLSVKSSIGTRSADSTEFIIRAGFIQFLTQSNDRELRTTKKIVGSVEQANSDVTFMHIGVDSLDLVADGNGQFSQTVELLEGINRFKATARDSSGSLYITNVLEINCFVDHAPKPEIQITCDQGNVLFTAIGNDPDEDPLTFYWSSDDAINPQALNISTNEQSFSIPIPEIAGDYYVDLEASDDDLNKGNARGYFTVTSEITAQIPTVNSNPYWVQDAIIYEIYLPAFTAEGTFAAAQQRLSYMKNLGINVIWLMPIYENSETINELNAGYNITDFYQVHPQLGTMQDFEDFLAEAHNLDLRIILDSTPNHVSSSHEIIEDIRLYRDYSNFRPYIETDIIGDDRGLGQVKTQVDTYTLYVHYSNWSLANLDYDNIETVVYMLDMYKYWLLNVGIDGFRMDVYWGPHNRYGKNQWWRPFREEIKRVKPDVFILGETDGTGVGSENNYADGGGASDAAYDWNLYGQIKSVLSGGSINELDNRVRNYSPDINYNFYTGLNSHYFRFLENHDEDRIAKTYGIAKSRAAAAMLFTIPGIPLIYAGQEIGETSMRGEINWQREGGGELFNFYQQLTTIRNRFATFRSPNIKKISSTGSRIYAYLRPSEDENGIAVVNFSSNATNTTLVINESDLSLSDTLERGKDYYLNDVLNDTTYLVAKSSLSNFQTVLPPWGSRVFIFADSVIQNVNPIRTRYITNVPDEFQLSQNYPNPFNPITNIEYTVGVYGQTPAHVELSIYNLLGQKVATVVNKMQPAGSYQVQWDASVFTSGVYLYRLTAGEFIQTKKLLLIK
jgi:glycosidase